MNHPSSLKIRPATLDDAPTMARIYAPYVLETPISFESIPPSAEEMRARLESGLKSFPWLVAEEKGQVVGYAYAGAHRVRACYRWSVDVSVYLLTECQGRGLGRDLYTRLFEILSDQGYVNAYAGITLPNPSSVGIHESFGFMPVGIYEGVGHKFGKWHDVGWWQKQLNPRDDSAQDPIPFEEFAAGISE